MNIVEVQENLKNFSQEQLVNEINKPSGMVPQFLVLTELGRRTRMKQDIEGQQAQNQPTVAQEVVSAAGVPQGGIMEMARSMAPKSSIEQNDGVAMMDEGGRPSRNRMDMLLAYLRSLGADEEEEIKEATGGKSIAEMINFGGDYGSVEKKSDGGVVKMATAGSPTREVVYEGQRYLTDGSGRVFKASRSGSMRRGQEVTNPEIVSAVLNTGPNVTTDLGGIGDISANLDTFNSMSEITPVNTPDPMFTLGNQMPSIASADDQPDKFTDLPQMPLVKDKNFTLKPYEGPNIGAFDATGTGSSENIDSVLNIPDLTAEMPIEKPDLKSIFEGSAIQYPNEEGSKIKGLAETNKILPDSVSTQFGPKIEASDVLSGMQPPEGFSGKDTLFKPEEESPINILNRRGNLSQLNQTGALDAEQESLGADTFANLSAEQSLMDEGMQITKSMDAADPLPPIDKKITDQLIDPTKKKPDPNSAVSSLESEIANMLKENEEDREQDKYLALAKMGLALMSSSQPTFGGALGEAGMAGVEDLQASKKAYRDDKVALLDAQRKLEQARATAASKDKSGLTGANIVSTLNNIRNQKAKAMSDLSKIAPSFEGGDLSEKQKNDAEMLKREIANLSVMESSYAGMLGGIGSLSSTGTFNATAN